MCPGVLALVATTLCAWATPALELMRSRAHVSGEACQQGRVLCAVQMLGTVGESINPAAWDWYKRAVGGGNVPVIDTYWQTETGGILLCNMPGAWPEKPGAATFPFFGINLALLDPETGRELEGPATGVLCIKQVRALIHEGAPPQLALDSTAPAHALRPWPAVDLCAESARGLS